MTTLLTTELIDRCHAGSRAKGFWDEVPPQGQQLMLVISELAEALEGHRKGKKVGVSPAGLKGMQDDATRENSGFKSCFEGFVKDTPADELADAYIRICDFIGGFKIDYLRAIDAYTKNKPADSFGEGNFGAALLSITYWLCKAKQEFNQAADLGIAARMIEALAEREGIDLATHIDLKLRYNATRGKLHGKAY